ncbi:hypothetical protein GIB67_004838 [Kingdonia uniflora]|uniref:D-isomer specific 2-hydroxyacid dehydrogenase catalytic domain-containing protein n=1 Tax=Kingdonia uniflora TaxID=39325 RepID=A0A7J7LNB4_9MAGN|nr:hypothetical protein GIB67_004838 [Kingdonia uniflora]
MGKPVSIKVQNPNGKYRVISTKPMPVTRWIRLLTDQDYRIEICTYKQAILLVEDIVALIGDKCDGVIGQLIEDWGEVLFSALSKAGGKAFSNMVVGYNNVDANAATKYGDSVGNTPGVLTETTIELAASLSLAAARRIVEADEFMKAYLYDGWLPHLFVGNLLKGQTVGAIGAGRKSSQIFDQVWHKFSGLGQISRTNTDDTLKFPMCEFTVPGAQNTTVLVVGATSRIGRVVVRKLMLRGYNVKVLISAKEEPGASIPPVIDGLLRVHKRTADSLDADLSNAPTLLSFLKGEGATLPKLAIPSRTPIQIRETLNGGITLAGVTEPEVRSKEEMTAYLFRGSLARAVGSTNMNSQSRCIVYPY